MNRVLHLLADWPSTIPATSAAIVESVRTVLDTSPYAVAMNEPTCVCARCALARQEPFLCELCGGAVPLVSLCACDDPDGSPRYRRTSPICASGNDDCPHTSRACAFCGSGEGRLPDGQPYRASVTVEELLPLIRRLRAAAAGIAAAAIIDTKDGGR